MSGGTVSVNTAYVATLVYDFNATNQLEGFLNGASVGSINDGSIGRLYAHGDAIGVGGISGGSLFPSAPTGTANTFGGDIAEIIYYQNAPLNEARRRIVENYLAGKYGISITNQYYGFGSTHSHEIAGIGRFNPSHLDAQGSGLVRVNNPSGMEAGEFLFWGHNNDTLEIGELGDTPPSIHNRMRRVWRAGGSGDVGNVTLRFDLSNFTVNAEADLELLIDGNGVFATGATQHTTGRSYDPGTKIVTFTNVDLNSGDFFTMGSNNVLTPLPIKLLNFEAKMVSEQAQLTWTTLTEINNAFFTVEKSRDAIFFEEVTTVEGAGNSNVIRKYETLDQQPYRGTSYYRLKQTDWNGDFEYSKLVALNNEPPRKVRMFPNPVKGTVFIELDYAYEGPVFLSINKAIGGEVFSQKRMVKDQQLLTLKLPQDLPSGMYLVQISTLSDRFTKKLILLD